MAEAIAVALSIEGVDAALSSADEGALPALLAKAEAVMAAAEHTGLPGVIGRGAACLARVLTRAGRPREALAPIARGLAALADAEGTFGKLELALAEAEAHRAIARGDGDDTAWQAALDACRRALPWVEEGRLGADAPQLQAGYMRGRSRLYAIGAHALLALGDPAGAVRLADQGKARGLPFRAASMRLDPDRLRAFRAADGGTALQRRQAWRALMRTATAPTAFEGVGLADAQAGLAEDQAALAWFWLADDQLLVAAFDRARSDIRAVPVSRAERVQMHRMAEVVVGGRRLDDVLDSMAQGALADILLPEWARAVALGRPRLVLMPHRVLHGLPLQVLPTPDGPLGLARGLSFAPSLAALTTQAHPAERGVAALWATEFDPDLLEMPGKSLSVLPETRAMAGAALEAAEARGEPTLALDADQPARARLLALSDSGDLRRMRQLWFCCHGQTLDIDSPLHTRLYLGREILDGLDIATLDLAADLVVLLACHAGKRAVRAAGLPELASDELLGLVGALRVAGARQVLAPQWPVQPWMLAEILPGLDLAGGRADLALQARLAQFSAKSMRRRAPVTWAPMQLFVLAQDASQGSQP